jgi:CBS domain-containing protein
MTPEPVTIAPQQAVHEAMLQMLRHNVHHLPVVNGGRVMGLLTLSDILRYESHNSLFVVGRLFKAQDVDELALLSAEVRDSFVHLVGEDGSPRVVGSAMAAIGRAFKQRLLELGEARFGPPPVPYAFLAMGSMARQEQLVVTDQDNAMVLDDRFDPALHDAYFLHLAEFVCHGLARCGYTLCSGGVMAMNAAWRQPLGAWEQQFTPLDGAADPADAAGGQHRLRHRRRLGPCGMGGAPARTRGA